MTVTVLGSANLDLVYRVEKIPAPGETVLATGFAEHPGGKGNNQVIAVARAGASVTFVAALGSDAAASTLTDQLHADGVNTLIRTVDAPTGTALITVDDGAENSIVVNSGANALLVDLDEREEQAIRDADVLLMQLETPVETVQRAAQIARDAGTTVVLNAAPILDLPSAVLEALDILIVNEHEAADLARFAGMDVAAADDADSLQAHRQLASTLTELVPIVVVTIGAAGVVVAQRGAENTRHIAGRRVTATDTTGAGDTFCGAFVAALDATRTGTDVSPTDAAASGVAASGDGALGDDAAAARSTRIDADALERAALFATAAAALSVQRSGAVPSIPNRQEIDDAL
ncbi:ribokinase [Okibacterium fritillariae]|uniref:Ribokinase n=1 Tax=Okibacterium fritillariae TaxID=123320 RepID=A0A1T5JS58_9MICO|nr:ribokinase [Okibacterium fritillariae]SKC54058.1 ribokinase [Okibacterium fritillariae]